MTEWPHVLDTQKNVHKEAHNVRRTGTCELANRLLSVSGHQLSVNSKPTTHNPTAAAQQPPPKLCLMCHIRNLWDS